MTRRQRRRTRAERRVAIRYQWDRLHVSFWFMPALMAIGAVMLAWTCSRLDELVPNETLQTSRLVMSGSVVELRATLLNIAGTILTTAGVVFTLLTLPLSTVAAQYGSRLLRLFLGDRTTQVVLGMFVGTFVYCLAAAMAIVPAALQPDGPQLTATVGLYLMLATFASLIALVQHMSTMLQAPNIAAAAGAELMAVVRGTLADDEYAGPDEVSELDAPGTPVVTSGLPLGWDAVTVAEAYPVTARKSGYIQAVDSAVALDLADARNVAVRLLRRPGQFVSPGSQVALLWPASRVDENLETRIRRCFYVGNLRTPTQDVTYAVNQLVEMAVRAMSPAINDPFTAMTCLDHIGAGLALFVQEDERRGGATASDELLGPEPVPATVDELLGAAFDMLRHASSGNATVLLRMLHVIEVIGHKAESSETRQRLLRHARLINSEVLGGNLIAEDREIIRQRTESLVEWLGSAA